ncbi:hypothetical protein TRIUR3_25394 [Triticum urartu]|uniref:Uncharacterized protein n=1 Tax=Triticum urartu TaxID=4572 RepID=M7ZTB2_TRIUA|nr:hypothetical protein TRIUR3_25394 [Triticum urartu]
MFVASEPLDDTLVLLVEDRSMIKEPALLGHATIPVSSVEQRLDERQIVASRWFNLEGGMGHGDSGDQQGQAPPGFYSGRLHLRLSLEGGYHVLDEAAHVCSDYRPTAKQLWKPPVGVLELGIVGACGLLPMKTKGGSKGSTDAYCVAKYGKKWVRTRTVTDTFNPRWNEQYTWQVGLDLGHQMGVSVVTVGDLRCVVYPRIVIQPRIFKRNPSASSLYLQCKPYASFMFSLMSNLRKVSHQDVRLVSSLENADSVGEPIVPTELSGDEGGFDKALLKFYLNQMNKLPPDLFMPEVKRMKGVNNWSRSVADLWIVLFQLE